MESNTTEVKSFETNTIDNSFKSIVEKHFGCKCEIERGIDIYIYSKEKPYKREIELMRMFPNMKNIEFHWMGGRNV